MCKQEKQEVSQEYGFPEELYQLKYCIPPKQGVTKEELRRIIREFQEVFQRIPGLKEEVERERAEQGLTKESDASR